MDLVPWCFVAGVLDMFTSAAPMSDFSRLQSRAWSTCAQSTTREWIWMVLHHDADRPDRVLCVLYCTSADERWKHMKMEDFRNRKNAIWHQVSLQTELNVPLNGSVNYSEATLDDSFIESLRRMFAGRNCGSFCSYILSYSTWFTDRMLPAFPTTFRKIYFMDSSEYVQEFVTETSKFQDIDCISMSCCSRNDELEDCLKQVLLSNALRYVCITNSRPRITFDFPIFEEIIERWVNNPEQFQSNSLSLEVPISFEPELFDRWCTRCRTRPEHERVTKYCKIDKSDETYMNISCRKEDEGYSC